MTVYLKFDTSKESEKSAKQFYFTDGADCMSKKNFTYKQALEQEKFLKSLGFTIEDHS